MIMTYYLLRCVWRLLSCLPLPVMYLLSDGIYYIVYYLGRYRRKVARKNLIESFPEKSLQEIKTIEKRFYRFFIDLILEMSKLMSFSKKEMAKRMRFSNIEMLNAEIQQGKSITLYMSHYGNWEWVSSLAMYLNPEPPVRFGMIYKKQHNESADKILLSNRGRMGGICVEMKQTMRWIEEQVKNKIATITCYVADQSPGKEQIRHYVPFLHHNAPAFIGAEKITKRYGFEAWYLDVRRLKRGYYEAAFVRLHEHPKSLPDFELTDSYYRRLEETICRQPELYLWTHNRFKHAGTKPLQEDKL